MKRILLLSCTILSFHFSVCDDHPVIECPNAPKNQQKIKYDVYYDAGEAAANFVLGQICPVFDKFGDRLTESFKPGAYVQTDASGKLVCPNSQNKSCAIPIVHACAVKLISNFKKFVCCCVMKDAAGSRQCALDGGAKQQDLDNCINGVDKQNNASEILLKNSEALVKKAKTVHYYPAHFFNDAYDACLAGQAHWHLVLTICKMLADPKPDACK